MEGVALLRIHRGTLTRLAHDLGVTVGAVTKWRRVPEDRLLEVERLTGISRAKLRPDLFAGYKPPKPRRGRK